MLLEYLSTSVSSPRDHSQTSESLQHGLQPPHAPQGSTLSDSGSRSGSVQCRRDLGIPTRASQINDALPGRSACVGTGEFASTRVAG